MIYNKLSEDTKLRYNLNHKKYFQLHREERREKMRLYYQLNKEEIKKLRKEQYLANCEEFKKKICKRHLERLKEDSNYKLRGHMRTRISNALKRNGAQKATNTVNLLGCTVPELKKHLESKFIEGMTWDNYGMSGWHVDHIIPCASFDLTNEEQQKKCFHHTNLQPLWAEDNMKKSDKIL